MWKWEASVTIIIWCWRTYLVVLSTWNNRFIYILSFCLMSIDTSTHVTNPFISVAFFIVITMLFVSFWFVLVWRVNRSWFLTILLQIFPFHLFGNLSMWSTKFLFSSPCWELFDNFASDLKTLLESSCFHFQCFISWILVWWCPHVLRLQGKCHKLILFHCRP